MNDKKDMPMVEEPIITKSKTEFDAVHPRFAEENPEEVLKYEQAHYYYCQECPLYFAPTYEGLRNHFDKEIITHTPYGSCFYCKGDVYAYSKRDQLKIYHNCRTNSTTKSKD